jgi:hypothetical protein
MGSFGGRFVYSPCLIIIIIVIIILITYLFAPSSSALLEKLTDSQLVKKFTAFESSLPHSQVTATCPYPEPA